MSLYITDTYMYIYIICNLFSQLDKKDFKKDSLNRTLNQHINNSCSCSSRYSIVDIYR